MTAPYHVHFTPTSASWINQVERWFAELTRKQLRRGVHTSIHQSETDIRAFIARTTNTPSPTNGPSPPTKSLRPNASAKGSKHLIQRTLDSRDLLERVLVNRTGNESYDGVNVKPSSIQPVTPPIIIFTGKPSRARRNAALLAPLQCGPAQ
jgi:hypothetical protein